MRSRGPPEQPGARASGRLRGPPGDRAHQREDRRGSLRAVRSSERSEEAGTAKAPATRVRGLRDVPGGGRESGRPEGGEQCGAADRRSSPRRS